MSYAIIGFDSSDKVPGYVGETKHGAGGIDPNSIPWRLLLVGQMDSGGSATEDTTLVQVFDDDQAADLFGARSELAQMFYRASAARAGVEIWCAPEAQDGAVAEAEAQIAISGTATATGELAYRVNGKRVSVSVATDETATTVGARLANAINAADFARLPCTASATTGTVTLTTVGHGARGNDLVLIEEDTEHAGLTVSVTDFASGTGVPDPTNVQALLFPEHFDHVALACRDAAGLALWESYADSKSAPLEGRPEHYIAFANGTYSASLSLAQTTLNHPRFSWVWALACEDDPAGNAAAWAARRQAREISNWAYPYVDEEIPGATPLLPENQPSRSELKTALNNGVTPCRNHNGRLVVSRSITTRSLDGSTPDYRTLDTSQAIVPDRVRLAVGIIWTSEFQPANPFVQDNPGDGDPEPPTGVATPNLWKQRIEKYLRELADGTASPSGLPQITNVDGNLPSAIYDSAANRIMAVIPIDVANGNYQTGASIRQVG